MPAEIRCRISCLALRHSAIIAMLIFVGKVFVVLLKNYTQRAMRQQLTTNTVQWVWPG